jgi:hypothetical protein
MEEVTTTPKSPKKIPLPKPKQSPVIVEITKLRSLQKSAVSALDLDAAEDLEKQISTISAETFAASVADIKSRMCGNVRSLIAEHQQHLENLRSSESSKIIEFRKHVNIEFDILKSKHLQELVALESEGASVRLKESQRLIPEYEELIAQSKSAAAVRDFGQARQLQALAASFAQAELEKRIAKVDSDLKLQTETLLQTQQKELELLVRKLEGGIGQIKGHTLRGLDAETEFKDVKMISALNKAVKELIVIVPPGVDAKAHSRDLENDVISLLVEANVPIPRKMKWNPKTATRGSAKSPHKGKGQ